MKNSKGVEIRIQVQNDLCPFCFGTGKVKAMQSVMTYKGGSKRGPDKAIKCVYCDGTGLRRSIK